MAVAVTMTMAVAVAEREAAESPVEAEGPSELGRVGYGVVSSVGFVEGVDLLQEGLEELVIHVGLLPFRNHLSGKLLAELHYGRCSCSTES